MELDEFKRAVSRLPKAEAREVRGRYIGTFVDMTRAECRQLADLSAAYPATTYWAYLWECLREPTVVDNRYALELADGLGEVLVFWDLHPDDRVLVQDYWKFERDDVLRLSYRLLLENLEHLPEDIYIFDRSFRWTLALTHEHVDQERWCLKSGDLPEGGTR